MIELDDIVVEVPQNPSKVWGDSLNTAFGGGRFILDLTTETWWTDPQRGRASAYLQANDQMGPQNWDHNVQGVFDGIVYTNLPEASSVKGNGFMIGLKEAKLDDQRKEIDEGHLTFVALHDVVGRLKFRVIAANI